MADNVLIFGKSTWPHTRAAREAIEKQGKDVEYRDVLESADNMDAMLKHSEGVRKVPVIVAGGDVTIGFKGETWGV